MDDFQGHRAWDAVVRHQVGARHGCALGLRGGGSLGRHLASTILAGTASGVVWLIFGEHAGELEPFADGSVGGAPSRVPRARRVVRGLERRPGGLGRRSTELAQGLQVVRHRLLETHGPLPREIQLRLSGQPRGGERVHLPGFDRVGARGHEQLRRRGRASRGGWMMKCPVREGESGRARVRHTSPAVVPVPLHPTHHPPTPRVTRDHVDYIASTPDRGTSAGSTIGREVTRDARTWDTTHARRTRTEAVIFAACRHPTGAAPSDDDTTTTQGHALPRPLTSSQAVPVRT